MCKVRDEGSRTSALREIQSFSHVKISVKMWKRRNIPAMFNTYNLDAVSPRITNKNSSQIICGEAEGKENFFITCSEKADLNVNRCRFYVADSAT